MKRLAVPVAVILARSTLLTACTAPTPAAPPTAQVIEKQVPVKETVTVKETVVVPGQPQVVEKVVEKVVTPPPEGPKPGGWITVNTIEDPDSLDPQKTSMATASSIQAWIYDRLFYIGSDGLPHGQIAESWTVSDDQKVLTVKVRQGMKFTDGTPVDAKAVEFTFKRALDPKTAAPLSKTNCGPMTDVTAVDDSTVKFTFSEPYAPFFFNASTSYLGILSPTAVQKLGDGFSRNPVGSGPFMLKEWKAGQTITLVRNPDYKNYREDRKNKGAPYAEGIIFKNIPERGTAIAAFETGDLNVLTLARESVPLFLGNPKYNILTAKETASFNFIEFNYKKPPFDDPNFRKVFGLAVDKSAVLAGAYGGFATVIDCPYPNGDTGYDATMCASSGFPKRDVDAAKKLLDQIGWKDDGSGVRKAQGVTGVKDGTPAEFTCWTYPLDIKKRECEIIQANLKDVGVKINVQLTDYGTMYAEMKKCGYDFDMMRWTWNEPSILTLLFKSPGWIGCLSDPDLDKMLAAMDSQMDPAKRVDLIKGVEKYVLDKAYVIPFTADWYMTASASNVQDLRYDKTFGLTYDDVWFKGQ